MSEIHELIGALIECLRQETEHYRRLALLASGQRELLVAGKVERLPENTRLEEKEVFALNPLIAKRNALLGKMAKVYRVQALSLAEALQRAPAEMIEDLKKAVIELVQSAKRLDEAGRSNEKLLHNALSYVDFTLKIIAGGGKKTTFSPSTAKEENNPSFVDRTV